MASIINFYSHLKEELLTLIYPKICFGCDKSLPPKHEGYLCPDCLDKINKPQPPFCISCGKSIDPAPGRCGIDRCPECAGYSYNFTRGYTASIYDGLIKDCLHNFKYNAHTYLANTLAGVMIDFALKHIDIGKIDAITSVPLHWKRLRDRGFNQASVLASILSKKVNKPFVKNSIYRTKVIKPQVELPRQDRIKNVQGVFRIKNPKNFLDKHILLIDDVFTTGATLNECSKVLLEAGAREVWVFTLTRGIK